MTDILDHLAPEVTLDVRPVRRQEEALCRWASLRLTHHSIHPLQDSVVPEIPGCAVLAVLTRAFPTGP